MTGEDNAMDITRRNWLAGASALFAMTPARTAHGGWEPSERYPDPAIQTLDPSFNKYLREARAILRRHNRHRDLGGFESAQRHQPDPGDDRRLYGEGQM